MTDKEKVLAQWPDAVVQYPGEWDWFIIELADNSVIGNGVSEPEAWADAARRLEDGK